MKLDQIALIAVIAYFLIWGTLMLTGLALTFPFGMLGLIPAALFIGLLISVIIQRLNNKEDDYYDKNVDM